MTASKRVQRTTGASEIPAEAVQAAAEALADYETAPHGDVRLNSQRAAVKAVAAAAPILAAHERRKVAEEIRDLARWEMQGGYIDLFALKNRHDRLSHIEVTHLSMAFRALADEIEGETRDPR